MYTSCPSSYPYFEPELFVPWLIFFEKNQCRLSARDRSMESRRKIIFCFLLLIAGFTLARSIEVDSQLDLDSDEKDEASTGPALKAFVNLNQGRLPTFSETSKPSAFRPNLDRDFPLVGEQKKRRRLSVQGDSSKQPTVVNNIQIVMNGNETGMNETSCENSVCNVSVSSSLNDAGNIVTNVHLSILTKLSKDSQANDIPVFDGVRGVESNYNPPPGFNLLNYPAMPRFHINIPQIQIRNPDYNEVWYRGRGSFYRPQTVWRYRHVAQPTSNKFYGHGGWIPSKPLVDDKIEPPLSRTRPSNE